MHKKKSSFVGIDVSKDTFNAHWKGKDAKYDNSQKGWRKLLKEAPVDSCFAMEATGNYHYRLASFLYQKGMAVLVLNPLRVRRWVQSLGGHADTDKIAAMHISWYAGAKEKENLSEWKPMSPKLARARAVVSALAGLSRLMTAAGNMRHAISFMAGKKDKDIPGAMDDVAGFCKEKKESLERELCGIVQEVYPDSFRLLKTIPGVGAKTAAVMLVCCGGLENFSSHRQLSSFVGVSPTVKESGTSVRGSGKVAKVGNPYLRSLLFMCSFTACRVCGPCEALYSRLLARGKSKMLALVAVMHRLVKIALGVVRSGEAYRGVKLSKAVKPT